MFCRICGNKLESNDKFCGRCGQKVENIEAVNTFAQQENLGVGPIQEKDTIIANQTKDIDLQQENLKDNTDSKEKKVVSKNKKLILGVGIGVSFAILFITSACFILSKIGLFKKSENKANIPFVYVKDNEILVKGTKLERPVVATDTLYDDKKSDYYWIGSYTFLSEDGSKMFFPDKIYKDSSSSEEKYNLYYKNANKEKQSMKDADDKGVRLASNISGYIYAPKSGNYVAYMKNKGDSEKSLYVHNLKEEVLIDKDITSAYVYFSKDEKYIYYLNYEDAKDYEKGGDLYIKELDSKNEKEKVDSNVYQIVKTSDDLSKIYYLKSYDETTDTFNLYLKEKGKVKEKILSQISSEVFVGSKGNIIYKKKDSKETNKSEGDLYVMTKDGEKKIDSGEIAYIIKTDEACENVVYAKSGQKGATDNDGLGEQNSNESTEDIYLANVKGTPTKLFETNAGEDESEYGMYAINFDLSVVYYLKNYKDQKGEMWFLRLNNGQIQKNYILDNDVRNIRMSEEGDIVLFNKDCRDDIADLYQIINGRTERIAFDVYDNAVAISKDGKNVVCLEDYNTKKGLGRLSIIRSFKKEVIEDDVRDFYYRGDDNVLYMTNYNNDRKFGELWYKYGNKKAEMVDDDVTAVIEY